MAFGILLTLTVYSLIAMMFAWTVKVEEEWDNQ